MLGRAALLTFVAVAATGLAFAGCGASDEDEIRDVSKAFLGSLSDKDGRRACGLTTFRASVQLTAIFAVYQDAVGTCENVVENTLARGSMASAAAVGTARLTVRDDRAVLRFRGDKDPLGLRRVDDSWRVDNLLNPRVDEAPRRPDRALTSRSDATQIKAAMLALYRAFTTRDYPRICDLISPRMEAPWLVNVLFVRIFTNPDDDASDVTCAGAFRMIEEIAKRRGRLREFRRLFKLVLTSSGHGSAKLSIHGTTATIGSGGHATPLVKLDGRWLLDSDPFAPDTPAAFERCWRRAGARIATDPSDLRFAAGGPRPRTTRAHGRVSAKGEDWRIFYVLRAGGADPGLARVVADPTAVPVVAYVRRAGTRARIVTRARTCGG